MKRHTFNVFSFGFGVVLILLAVGLVVPTEFSDVVSFRWLVPLALVLVGVSMLGSLFPGRKTDPDQAVSSDGEPDENRPEGATESAST